MQAIRGRVVYLVEWPVAVDIGSSRRWIESLELAEIRFETEVETMRRVSATHGQSTVWSRSSVRLIEFRLGTDQSLADFLNGDGVRRKVIRSVEFPLQVGRLPDDSPIIRDIVDRLGQVGESIEAVLGVASNADGIIDSVQRSIESHADDAVGAIAGIVEDYAETSSSPGKWVVADAC